MRSWIIGLVLGVLTTVSAWQLPMFQESFPAGTDPVSPGRPVGAGVDAASVIPASDPIEVVATAPYSESTPGTNPVRADLRGMDVHTFQIKRFNVARDVAKLLGDHAYVASIQDHIQTAQELESVRILAMDTFRAMEAADRIPADMAFNISARRRETGQCENVPLAPVAREPDSQGSATFLETRVEAEFPEQWVVRGTTTLPDGQPVEQVVRINPGEDAAFDELNRERMDRRNEARSLLRSALSRRMR